MTSSIRFDDSLPAFAALVQQEWGASAIAENIFLRDVPGRLTFVVLNEQFLAEASNDACLKGKHGTLNPNLVGHIRH